MPWLSIPRLSENRGTGLLLDFVNDKIASGGCIEEAASEPMGQNGGLAEKRGVEKEKRVTKGNSRGIQMEFNWNPKIYLHVVMRCPCFFFSPLRSYVGVRSWAKGSKERREAFWG